MRTVSIVLELKDDKQAGDLEKYLRNMLGEQVISYTFLPDTEELYNNDPVFRKMLKKQKADKKILGDYVDRHS